PRSAATSTAVLSYYHPCRTARSYHFERMPPASATTVATSRTLPHTSIQFLVQKLLTQGDGAGSESSGARAWIVIARGQARARAASIGYVATAPGSLKPPRGRPPCRYGVSR